MITIGHTVDGNEPLRLDVPRLVATRLLIQGRSGGGKSWTVRRLLEQTHGGIQHLVLDPEGEFASLRERYDYVLAGRGGDIAADPATAALLARRLLELRVSAVLDLYELKAGERRRFVKLFLEALINAPKDLWHPALIVLDEAHMFCMDDETEILTQDGWRRREQVSVGMDVIAFDMESATCRPESIERVIIKHHAGDMVALRSDGIDCLVTPEHRVVLRRIQRAKGRYHLYPWTFCPAAKVPHHVYIPVPRPTAGPGIPDLPEDMCALLGWVITDGCYVGGGKARGYLGISQSSVTRKNGHGMVAVLDALMERLGARGRYERPVRVGKGRDGREKRSAPSVEYYLGKKLSTQALAWLGDDIHRVPRRVLTHASQEQLRSLFEGLMRGDGTAGKHGWKTFYPGHNEGLADDLQELATRLGISTSKVYYDKSGQWWVLLSHRKQHYIRSPQESEYRGIVWDITVPSGAFVARRHGKVFVTGNCPETGKAESAEAVIELCQRGRKRGFAAVLATQRLANLSKQAAAQCANVMVGPTFIDIDRKRACEILGVPSDRKMLGHLMDLKPGQFWCVGAAFDPGALSLAQIGPVETHHPEIAGGKKAALGPPPAPEKVRAMLSKLEGLPQEAADEVSETDRLRTRVMQLDTEVGRLGRELVAAKQTVGVPDAQMARREADWKSRFDDLKRDRDRLGKAMALIGGAISEMGDLDALARVGDRILRLVNQHDKGEYAGDLAPAPIAAAAPAKPSISRQSTVRAMSRQSPSLPAKDDHHLRSGARRMLEVMARHHPMVMTRSQLATLAGYGPKGGTFGTYLSDLKRNDFIQINGREVRITEAGLAACGTVAGALTADEILETWRRALRSGARAMLDFLVDVYPGGMSRAELGEKAGYEVSGGTFGTYLSDLRRNGLVDDRNGLLRASDTLFMGER